MCVWAILINTVFDKHKRTGSGPHMLGKNLICQKLYNHVKQAKINSLLKMSEKSTLCPRPWVVLRKFTFKLTEASLLPLRPTFCHSLHSGSIWSFSCVPGQATYLPYVQIGQCFILKDQRNSILHLSGELMY